VRAISGTMKIGILQCDPVKEEFRTDYGNYPDMFHSLFAQVDQDLSFETYDVENQFYPKQMDDCDAYLITGSRYSVYDEELWIRRLEQYVRQLHEKKKKLIGICFGHQLIAQALGGKTKEQVEKGWGVGASYCDWKSKATWLDEQPAAFTLWVSHRDQVTELPAQAVLLFGNEFCPIAGFQVGEHILTFQGHPEFTKQYLKALMMSRTESIGKEKLNQAFNSLNSDTQHLDVASWILQFIREKHS